VILLLKKLTTPKLKSPDQAMNTAEIQYVANEQGTPTAVIVPIESWQQITAEQETTYLLKSATMKQRLLAAKGRKEGIEFGAACEELGI
jgi:hypothetical protein